MKNRYVPLLVGCLSCAVLATGCGEKKERQASAPAAWPAGTLHVLGGAAEPLDLAALRGKVLLLDFWAPWSAPSKAALSELRQWHEQLAPQSFSVVGMTVAERITKELEAEVAGFGLPYPVVVADETARRTQGADRVVPTRVLIGRDGAVLRTYRGAVDLARLRSEVEHALRGEALPPEPDAR